MHRLHIQQVGRANGKVREEILSAPALVIGERFPLVRVEPQVMGTGFGITILTMDGAPLLTVSQSGEVNYPQRTEP